MAAGSEVVMGRKIPPVICPYCNIPAVLVPDSEVYHGRSYGGNVYLCRTCGAKVGCHKGGKTPLGRLANAQLQKFAQLQKLKIRCHFLFDALWRAAIRHRGWSKSHARNTAYAWLAKEMGIPTGECHFGMMDDDRCLQAIGILEACYNKKCNNERGGDMPELEGK
jgi:hypothetical protein